MTKTTYYQIQKGCLKLQTQSWFGCDDEVYIEMKKGIWFPWEIDLFGSPESKRFQVSISPKIWRKRQSQYMIQTIRCVSRNMTRWHENTYVIASHHYYDNQQSKRRSNITRNTRYAFWKKIVIHILRIMSPKHGKNIHQHQTTESRKKIPNCEKSLTKNDQTL